MKQYGHLVRAILDAPWAITPGMLSLIVEIVHMRAEGESFTEEEIRERIAAAQTRQGARSGPQTVSSKGGAVAVIPIYGPISARASMMSETSGGTSLSRTSQQFRQAMADPDVGSVLFDVDSPGGMVEGTAEFAREVRASRGSKPIVAHANLYAASAAYWIASAADELVASPTAQVGSIGILTAHEDWSAAAEKAGVKTTLLSSTRAPFKTEGNRFEPLSDEARVDIQKRLDAYHAMFETDVARGRGVAIDRVRRDFGQGRMLMARDALSAGMIDGIETFDETVRRLARGGAIARPLAAPEPDPDEDGSDSDDSEGETEHVSPSTSASFTGSLVTDLSFASRLKLATADARDLAQIAQERAERRREAGRSLSQEAKAGMIELREHLLATAASLDSALDEPDPEPRRVRRSLALIEAAARGYNI